MPAQVHGEQLRIDVVRGDVVRVELSRGGVFDVKRTYAVCCDPLPGAVDVGVEREQDRVLVISDELVLTLWLDPFRIDVHRADGSPVVESAPDEHGRYWTYATPGDARQVRRRCGGDDAMYRLGEKGGRHNRRGRDFTLWNTDVLDPHATAEFRAGRAPGGPAR